VHAASLFVVKIAQPSSSCLAPWQEHFSEMNCSTLDFLRNKTQKSKNINIVNSCISGFSYQDVTVCLILRKFYRTFLLFGEKKGERVMVCKMLRKDFKEHPILLLG